MFEIEIHGELLLLLHLTEKNIIFRGGEGMAAGHTNVLLTSVIIFINIEILYTWSKIWLSEIF